MPADPQMVKKYFLMQEICSNNFVNHKKLVQMKKSVLEKQTHL